ncbi:CGNR zinc finger domain-containing protein [Arenibaculum sp.]|uniref:CGNR zinc finger domain-containing protein n=1 Tax=Arenibaculum sp. TaxID=2865862 RepID=UPI002E118DD5|nr:CGNR zinc finger domain-containing protein [Arenibaculum sp.]
MREPEGFVLALVNTVDPVRPVPDLLVDAEGCRDFLKAWLDTAPEPDDAGAIRAVRDRVRAAALALAEGRSGREVAESLDTLVTRVAFRASVRAGDDAPAVGMAPAPGTEPADRLAAYAVLALADVIEARGAGRLRQCESAPCEEVFVDASKAGQQRFCSKRCATRFHVARHRHRKAGGSG